MDDQPDLTSLSERLRFLRERAGLSRASLSEELRSRNLRYCSVMQIRRYESGEASPSVDIVQAVAGLTGASAAWIVSGPDVERDDHGPDPTGLPEPVRRDALRILGCVEAELARLEAENRDDALRATLEVVGRRVRRLRAEGGLGDAGYAYWRGLVRGAALAAGGSPDDDDVSPIDPLP